MDVRARTQYSRNIFRNTLQGIKFALYGVVILSSIYAVSHIHLSRFFPIKKVQIYGVNRIDQDEVHSLLLPLVNHGFFAADVDRIRDQLVQLPWVSTTVVRRVWPDQIEITFIEKVPVARWNDQSLLSEGGELFSPKQDTYPSDLAAFVGPDGKQIEMLQYFYEMNRLLSPLHARISYLELSPFSTWKLTLTNGISLQLGHKDVLTRLGHFVRVYPKMIGSREGDVEYIDLRYSNGIAVRWKNKDLEE